MARIELRLMRISKYYYNSNFIGHKGGGRSRRANRQLRLAFTFVRICVKERMLVAVPLLV